MTKEEFIWWHFLISPQTPWICFHFSILFTTQKHEWKISIAKICTLYHCLAPKSYLHWITYSWPNYGLLEPSSEKSDYQPPARSSETYEVEKNLRFDDKETLIWNPYKIQPQGKKEKKVLIFIFNFKKSNQVMIKISVHLKFSIQLYDHILFQHVLNFVSPMITKLQFHAFFSSFWVAMKEFGYFAAYPQLFFFLPMLIDQKINFLNKICIGCGLKIR